MENAQAALRTYLAETGESMRSLSLRAGLNAKAVSDILTVDGLRPKRSTVTALAAAMGREIALSATQVPITFAELIARLPDRVADEKKAQRMVQRLRWLLRRAGWVAELQVVDRDAVVRFFAGCTPATFGLSAASFATYKAEAMMALDSAMPRARERGVADIDGIYARVHKTITKSDLPTDQKLISGSFLVFLHDSDIAPGDISVETLAAYFEHRRVVSSKSEATARKHVKRIASLLEGLASKPDFVAFGFAAPKHPFADRRDRYGVSDGVIASIMSEFDSLLTPWAQGRLSRDGLSYEEFLARLDTQRPSCADEKKALLRRSGIRMPRQSADKTRNEALAAHGFLLPSACWSNSTLATRRGFVTAGVKALYARTGVLSETIAELTDPDMAWSVATTLVETNQTGFHSEYAQSFMKMIVKIAEGFVCRSDEDLADLRSNVVALRGERGMSERNIVKLKQFTAERIDAFLRVSDRILDDVNARTERHRATQRALTGRAGAIALDAEQRRDLMCALAHEIMLVRAPRSANVFGIHLDWLRWTDDRVTIVVPSASVKMRGHQDPDLPIELSQSASKLLRQYIEKVRPLALHAGDIDNPYLFPAQAAALTVGQPYQRLLERLVGWVHRIVGVRINPHLYRHLIGWIWLRQNIDMLPVVQKLLGHRNLQTTIDYYASIDESLAMQKWQEFICASRTK